MIDINRELNRLINFALKNNLIDLNDLTWAANNLIGELNLNNFEREELEPEDFKLNSPDEILNKILDWAVTQKLIEDTTAQRDLLDTRLM